CAETGRCPRTRASGSVGSRTARRAAPSPPSPCARAAVRREGCRGFRAAPRSSSRGAQLREERIALELGAERRGGAVPGIDPRLRREAVGERADRGDERVPVAAREIGSADAACEDEVAGEQA